MTIIFNLGSENKGGTLEQAKINAKVWLDSIHKEFPEVEMIFDEQDGEGGDFIFNFTHKVTNKIVQLVIHGFTTEQCDKFRFYPRVYWNGSSTGDPKIEDWLQEGFSYRIVYYKLESKPELNNKLNQ